MTTLSTTTPLDSVLEKSTTKVDWDNLQDQNIPILVGRKFLDRPKAGTFDFNVHVLKDSVDLSNKLVSAVFERHLLGLAAPYMGIDFRVIAISGMDHAMFNPIVVAYGDDKEYDEVCPAFPVQTFAIKRKTIVDVKYIDPLGKFIKSTYNGLTARVILQLMEVINGGSVLDHVSEFRRKKVLTKVEKLNKLCV